MGKVGFDVVRQERKIRVVKYYSFRKWQGVGYLQFGLRFICVVTHMTQIA